jgi:hypothetical protein
VNPDKLFNKDGDTIVGCYHNTRGLWQISYDPETNSVYVPFHDQCLSMASGQQQSDRLRAADRCAPSRRGSEALHGRGEESMRRPARCA